MPAGTVKVDVSDVYDWYKLGTHISNLKGLGHHDFGAGPPSTIVSFGDEDTEHKFIQDLRATGLDVTDIDPRDPRQSPGMKKIKTDPTYNVDESEVLDEIKMSPTNLRAEAAKTGARAGMEFEMIVPPMGGADDVEYEPDYDRDQRCRSIDDAVEFFQDGDGDVERLRKRMRADYEEWVMDQIDNDWGNDKDDVIRSWVQENVDPEEWLPLVDDNTSEEEAFEQFVGDIVDDSDNDYHQQALDEFREEKYQDYDENDWLRDQDLDMMSSIENAYDIKWPYWNEISSGAGVDIDQVADSFSQAIGRPVIASYRYKGAEREEGKYFVEPDGSLKPNSSDDMGLEFGTPKGGLPLDELLTDLPKVKAWAIKNGCYTGKANKTGLHINVSVPGYDLSKLDYVKLALLLGDEYVLQQFGRSAEPYAKSSMIKVREIVRQNPNQAQALLDKMRGHMNQFASRVIQSGSEEKMVSINTQDKDVYIEFRSPGGDWLKANFDKIENTLMRFVVATAAAFDPEAYREEYQKKLYDLLTGKTATRDPKTGDIEWTIDAKAPVWYKDERTVDGKKVFTPKQRPAFSTTVTASTADAAWKKAQEQNSTELSGAKKSDYVIEPKKKSQSNNEDLLKIFSQYSAGKLPESALRSFVKQAQLKRQIARDPTGGQQYWWRVYKDGKGARNGAMIEVVARTKAEAIDKAGAEWGLFSREYRNLMDAEPIRPYDQSPAKARVGEPQPVGQQIDYEIFNVPNSTVVHNFRARDDEAALAYFDQYMSPGDSIFYDVRRAPAAPQQTYLINNGSYNTSSIRSSSTEDAIQQFRDRISNESNPSTYSLISADNQVVARGGDQGTGTHTYRAFDLRNNQTLGTFQGGEPGSDSAAEAFADMLAREGISAQYADYEVIGQERQPPQPTAARPNRPNIGSQTDMENRLGWPGQTGNANYEIVDRRTQQPVFVFIANTEADAAQKYQQWLAAAGYSSDPQELGWRRRQTTQAAPQQSSGEFTGNWLIQDPQGRTIHRFGGVGNVQSDANRVAIAWLRAHPGSMQAGVTVVPEMQ
jgi:hypothetical protein